MRLAENDSIWRVQDRSGVFLSSLLKTESEEPTGIWVPLHTSQNSFPGKSITSPSLGSSQGQGKGFITTGEF